MGGGIGWCRRGEVRMSGEVSGEGGYIESPPSLFCLSIFLPPSSFLPPSHTHTEDDKYSHVLAYTRTNTSHVLSHALPLK
jgi:hypothetical protein